MVDQVTSKRGAFGRFVAFLLAALLCVQTVPLSAFATDANVTEGENAAGVEPVALDGLEFAVQWVDAEDPTLLQWDSVQEEEKTIRLSVSYASTEVTDGYEAGSIMITVPGIGDAYRFGTMEATSVAADVADATEKTYDWSYSYDAETDVYTFANNNSISAETNFLGSFEILWTMDSRDTVHGYQKDIVASISAQSTTQTEAQTAESNAVSFRFTSATDVYSVSSAFGALTCADGLPEDYENYIWVEYEFAGDVEPAARGLSSAAYVLTLEEDAVLQSVRSAYGYDRAYEALEDGSFRIVRSVGEDSWVWQYEPIVIVGYPKATYDGVSTSLGIQLVGQYYETDAEQVLAEATVDHVLAEQDYAFSYEGELYSVDKSSSIEVDALEYDTLFDGVTVEYYLSATARIAPGSDYTVSLIDDFQDVLLNDGTIYELEKYDYYVQKVEIPDTLWITNGLGQHPEDGEYTCELWYDMGSGFNKIGTYELSSYSHPSMTLPYGTKAVKFSFPGVNETFDIQSIPVYVRYVLPDELMETDGDDAAMLATRVNDWGRVRNVAGIIVEDAEGNLQNSVGLDSYEGNLGDYVAARDLETYGHYVQRSYTDIDIVPVNDEWSQSTSVNAAEYASNSAGFYSDVWMSTYMGASTSQDTEVSSFSQYAILPLGMSVGERVYSPTFEPYEITTVSGVEVTADYLASRATVEVVNDYRGSDRAYVAVHYDFSDDPMVFGLYDSVGVTFPVEVSLISYLEHGSSYRLEAASIFHSATGTQVMSSNGGYDDGTDFSETELWSDLDGDGDTTEILSYRSSATSITAALATHQEASESVRTESGGVWETDVYADFGEGYAWRPQMVTGSSGVQDLVLFDGLVGEGDWDGAFADVDVSYLEAQGYAPVVYYSADAGAAFDLADSAWVERDAWALDIADVAAVAVALPGQTIPAQSLAYAVVNMTAPLDEALLGQAARDSYTAQFVPVDAETGVALGAETLVSGEVTVTLGPEQATLPKTDVILTTLAAAPDGTPLGTTLSYAYFDLYQADGTRIGSSLKPDSNGQILVEALAAGSYYFLQTTSMTGYVANSSKIEFTIDETNASETVPVEVEVLNLRKGGKVRLVKMDQDGNLIEGAVFSLYAEGGTLIAEDLTTDANGRIDYGGLDWLSYYFVETDAPEGYSFDAEAKYEFQIERLTVNDLAVVIVKNERVEGEVADEGTGKSVTVMKRIAAAEVHWDHGEPTFLFKLAAADGGRTLYEQVRFTQECVADAEGFLSLTATFTGLEAGEWTLTEMDAVRYDTAEISSSAGAVSSGSVTFDLSAIDAGEATFVNGKAVHTGLSDTALAVNSLNGPEQATVAAGESYAVLTDDYKLTFLDLEAAPSVGDDFEGASVLAVYEGRTADATGYEETIFTKSGDVPWTDYKRKIVEVEVRDEVNPIGTAYWFSYFDSMITADVAKINMENVFDMHYMFYGNKLLTSADVEGWQTGSLENVKYAFYNCAVLTADCSAWDVANVTAYGGFNGSAPGVTAPNWAS